MKYFEEHKCIECGATILGRCDKKFCSLNCKNRYNNRRIKQSKAHKLGVINKISRNYEILETLLDEAQGFYNLEELSTLGFDNNYITGVRHIGTRHQKYMCFDIAYHISGSRISKIERVDITTL